MKCNVLICIYIHSFFLKYVVCTRTQLVQLAINKSDLPDIQAGISKRHLEGKYSK